MATKETPASLTLHVHAERMSWDRHCIFVHATFCVSETDRDRFYCRDNSTPTKVGSESRVNDLGFTLILTGYQGDAEKATREHDYAIKRGVELEYRDVHKIEARDARAMAKTLDAIERKLSKVEERYGRAESFTASLRRVCDVLGVETIEFSQATIAMVRKLHDWELGRDKHGNKTVIRENVETGARLFEQLTYSVCMPSDEVKTA